MDPLESTRSTGDAHDRDDDERAEHRRMELREEELAARTERVEAGVVRLRREVEQVPTHLDVETERDEVQVQRETIGREVGERQAPWEEDGDMIIPIYEEQVVVSKRLVLKEQIRVRRVLRHETRRIEDTVRRERLIIDDADHTGQVRETYATDEAPADDREEHRENPIERALRKALS